MRGAVVLGATGLICCVALSLRGQDAAEGGRVTVSAGTPAVTQVGEGDWVELISEEPVAWMALDPVDLDGRMYAVIPWAQLPVTAETKPRFVYVFQADRGRARYIVASIANGPVVPRIVPHVVEVDSPGPPTPEPPDPKPPTPTPTPSRFDIREPTRIAVAGLPGAARARAGRLAVGMSAEAAAIRAGVYGHLIGSTWDKVRKISERIDDANERTLDGVLDSWRPILSMWGLKTATANSSGKLVSLTDYAALLEEIVEGLQ